MGCECSTNNTDDKNAFPMAQPSDCHPLVVETATEVERVRALEAIRKNDSVLVQKLLATIEPRQNLYEKGANYTCIHAAAEYNAYNVIEPFLHWVKRNLNQHYKEVVNIQDKFGRTPAMLCGSNDSAETLFALLSNGDIDSELRDKEQKNVEEICKEKAPRCATVVEHFKDPSKQGDVPNKNIPDKDYNSSGSFASTGSVPKAGDVVGDILKKLTKAQIARSLEELNISKISLQQNVHPLLQGLPVKSSTYQYLSQSLVSGNNFNDKGFQHNLKSITAENHPQMDIYVKATWRRPNDILGVDFNQIQLINNIDPNDLQQGKHGVTYFLAALCAIAEFPAKLTKIFINKEVNKYGVYGMTFYVQGIPTEIVIDDYFPTIEEEGKVIPLFSRNKSKDIWVLALEKAWAKLYGNYIACQTGFIDEVFEYLLGTPSFRHDVNGQSEDEIWETLKEAFKDNYIICAATGGEAKPETGLIAGQSYSIISIHHIGNNKILKMRNPWGTAEWRGDFADNSNLWTVELKQKIGSVDAADGVFCMPIKDFKENFSYYSTGMYKEGWDYRYMKGNNDPKHPDYYKFTVTDTCNAYFRVHLKDKKMVPPEQRANYVYPQCDFMLTKVESDDTLTNLIPEARDQPFFSRNGSRTVYATKNHKIRLTPGTYVVRVKAYWKLDQRYDYTVSVYSDHKIDLIRITHIPDFFKRIYKRAGAKTAEKLKLNDTTSLSTGTNGKNVWVCIDNQSNQEIGVEFKLNTLQNYKIAKPVRLNDTTMRIIVPPMRSEVGFLKKVAFSEMSNFSWEYKLLDPKDLPKKA